MMNIVEKLSELEHEQWRKWSKSVMGELMGGPMDTHHDVAERVTDKHQSWLEDWKPYAELPEDVKEKDREWARKVLQIIIEEARGFECCPYCGNPNLENEHYCQECDSRISTPEDAAWFAKHLSDKIEVEE